MADGESVSRERITDPLASWAGGDPGSEDRLFTALYQELRRLARHQLRGRPGGGTLDTSGLIHEAYLRLVDGSRTRVRDRGHFLALTSRVMRQIVVDYARRKQAGKRGGGQQPRAARLVDLRFFGGLSMEETADILEVSIATAKRDWERARAHLYLQIKQAPLA